MQSSQVRHGEYERAARLEHPNDLGDWQEDILQVLEHLIANDDINGCVGAGKGVLLQVQRGDVDVPPSRDLSLLGKNFDAVRRSAQNVAIQLCRLTIPAADIQQ